jgi:hypothetical protein
MFARCRAIWRCSAIESMVRRRPIPTDDALETAEKIDI